MINQQIINGIGQLPEVLRATGCKRVFLVAGSSLSRQPFYADIEALEVERVTFSDYTPNPTYEQISRGITLFRETGCDGILAIGGGSPIDVAKCIKLAVLAREGNDAILPPLVNQRVEIDGSKIPLIAIPTTAGTGSESTHNAVMYYEGSKQTVTHDGILPDYAILDPIVLNTLPDYQRKCTMMDALCQAMEAWWSVHSNEDSHVYSQKAIQLIMQNWEAYIFDHNAEAARQMLIGANYAGRAINITATTAAHAMSYKITSLLHLPHGHAVACCLPYIWRYMAAHPEHTIDTRGQQHLLATFQQIAETMGCLTVEGAIEKFEEMMDRMELRQPVLNTPEELETLTLSVNPTRLKNNPVYLSEEVLRSLYQQITQRND